MSAWSEIVSELNTDQQREMMRRERIEHGQQVLLGQLIRVMSLMAHDITGNDLSDADYMDIADVMALAVEANKYGSEFFEFHGSRN
jgi:hypothetical protein